MARSAWLAWCLLMMLIVHDVHMVHAAVMSHHPNMQRDIPRAESRPKTGPTHLHEIPQLPKGYVHAQRQYHSDAAAKPTTHTRAAAGETWGAGGAKPPTMRTFEVGGATVTLGDPLTTTTELPDYVITDAHIDYTKRGTVTAANLTVSISFSMTGNAYGKVARFRVTDKNNRTAVLMVRAMPTLYPLVTNLGQLVPEIVKSYATTVSEADPTFSDLARATPSTAANFVPLGTIGQPNVTAPVTSGQVAAAANASLSGGSGSGGSGNRRLLALDPFTVDHTPIGSGGVCCSSTLLTRTEQNMCFGAGQAQVDVDPMPYTVRGSQNQKMNDFCRNDAQATTQWDADVNAARTLESIRDIAGTPGSGANNRMACAMAILRYIQDDPLLQNLGARRIPPKSLQNMVGELMTLPEYSHFQIARGQATMQCVMAEPDAHGDPADTTGISCTPDLERPVQIPVPGQLFGFYETIGTPCPCAPQTNRYYRTCTLNPWKANGDPFPTENAGAVQKCAFVPFATADQQKNAELSRQVGQVTGTASRPIPGQGFCMPYTAEKSDSNAWIDNLREDLTTTQTLSYKDCGSENKALRVGVNAAFGALMPLAFVSGTLWSGSGWGSWPFPKTCPRIEFNVDDNSYRGSEIQATATNNINQAVSLLSLIGDQTTAVNLAQQVAIRAADAIRISANVSLATYATVTKLAQFEQNTTTNMRILNATASDLTARIQSSQAETESALFAVETRVNATRAQMLTYRAGSALFYATANKSLELQQNLLDEQRTQLSYLLSVEKRNRQAIQDLTAAFSRYTQGRDPFRRAMKALHKMFDLARDMDGLFPFTTRQPDGTGSFAPRLPTPEESNLVIDRSWVYFGTASRPPRYNRTAATMSVAGAAAYNAPGTIWLTRQNYELRCSLGFLSSLTRVNLTTESFKVLLGGDGCDPNADFGGAIDPVTNQTTAPSQNACNCVVQVTESMCATVHASADAYLSTINNPLLNAYVEPLGSTVVGTTGFAEAHACVPTTETTTLATRTFHSSVELDPFLTETCVSRENVGMLYNAQWGPITYVTQERGQHVFNVPDWTQMRNATRGLVVPDVSLDDYSSSILGGAPRGSLTSSIWTLSALTNASRTPQDWCTTVPRETLMQTSYTKLQLFPQRIYSYWPYVLMRFMGSPFLKEMDMALNGRAPMFGVNQVWRAYDNQPHPGDVTSEPTVGANYSVPAFPAGGTREEFDLYMNKLTESMEQFDRPFNCLEHNFVATGAHMMPVFYPRLGKPVRQVLAQFVNTNGLVVPVGSDATTTATFNISQADVDFFNAQLADRPVLESKDQSASDATASSSLVQLRDIETMVGYLSCKYDHTPCAFPQRASVPLAASYNNDTAAMQQQLLQSDAANLTTRGWYTYSADTTQLAAFARTLAQRHGTMNYIRTRVPMRIQPADTLSMQDLGFNATQRRPMISAQTFLFEEVVQSIDPETYATLAAQLLRTSTELPPRVNWDLLQLTDPQLQSLMHQVLLSPTHRYDPMQAGFNPDAQRVPLVDVTDLSYETDPDAVGVQCTTPQGHPNVVSRRSTRQAGAQSDEEKFHEAWNVVRDVRPWGIVDAASSPFYDAGRDPDRADTWKTLWVVPASEVVSVTIVIGQAQIDQLFQVQTACPRNTKMNQATTSRPIVSMVRPGPDQTVTLRFNVTTASRNQSCDGIKIVTLPAVSPSQQQSTFDILYVNFSSALIDVPATDARGCSGVRSVIMDRIDMIDSVTGLTAEQHCWSFKMDGADALLPAGEQMLFQAQSTVDTDASFAVQKIAQQMSDVLDGLNANMLAELDRKMSVMEYAYANGVTVAQAETSTGGPTAADFTDTLARLRASINTTVFNTPITATTDPDAVIAQLRQVVNQTELERLTGPNGTLTTATNIYALTQTILQEEAALQLQNNNTYYASITAPLIHIDSVMTSAEYKRNLAITAAWIDNSTQIDWACMARLEDARFYDLTIDATFPSRLRDLRDAIQRQDDSCAPGFHNFWMFGTVNTPQSNGPLGPDTTHYTGAFCSQAGDVGLEIIWNLIMLALILLLYSAARALLIKMGTPGSGFWYSSTVADSDWFRNWKARAQRQHAEYKSYMSDGADAEGAGAPSNSPLEMMPLRSVGPKVVPSASLMAAAPAAGHGVDMRHTIPLRAGDPRNCHEPPFSTHTIFGSSGGKARWSRLEEM